MIIWPDKKLIIAIHDRQLADYGGTSGMRDETLLESALARPQQLHAYGDPQPDLADLATSLAFGIARNHPFVDGNKRTATVACELFIRLNGGRINATDAELYPRYLALAEGKITDTEFAGWLRSRIELNTPNQVQEPAARYRK